MIGFDILFWQCYTGLASLFRKVAPVEQDSNPYIFGNPETDRQRLETQSRLFTRYIRAHARAFCGDKVHRILDVGCG
jgi:hypothetical protein